MTVIENRQSAAPTGLAFSGDAYPALTRWANFGRAYGAGVVATCNEYACKLAMYSPSFRLCEKDGAFGFSDHAIMLGS